MSKAYLVLSPHQDDELLTLGIPAALALENGYEIYIALITDGGGSCVKQQLGLDSKEFIDARDEEFRASCLAIGYENTNILIQDAGRRAPDGQLTPSTAEEQIRHFIASLSGKFDELTIATISPFGTETQHSDHRALGEAALALYRNSSSRAELGISRLDLFLEPYEFAKMDDTRFFNRIKPDNLKPIERSADGYKNSKYGIAFLSVPRELNDFLANPEAYQDDHEKRLEHKRVEAPPHKIKASLRSAIKKALVPADGILSRMKCKKVSFDPKMLNDPEFITCEDYIYNRPDLFTDNREAFEVAFGGNKYLIQVVYNNDQAELCIRLSNIPEQAALMLCDFIFKQHPEVQKVHMVQVYFQLGQAVETNHIRVVFPKTVEELNARLSSHTRSEIKRKHRRLIAEHGETHFVEYDRKNITDRIVNTYFEFKKRTHGRDYGMTPTEYLDAYHVTNAYVLYVNDSIIGVWFSCEQCDTVNAENFSYDDRYSWYSPGILVHQFALKRLVEKGKKQIFLGDGHQGQKLMFGSVDEKTWSNTVFRSERSQETDLPFVRMAANGARRRADEAKSRIKHEHINDEGNEPYREVFFSIGKESVAPQPLLKNEAQFVTVRNIKGFEKFAASYSSSLDKIYVFRSPDAALDEGMLNLKRKIADRFAAGSTFSALCRDGSCLSSGWLATGQDFYISEIDIKLHMGTSTCGILYDFLTEPGARGQGLYPYLLGRMMNEATVERGCRSFIIYTSEDNEASSRGIAKAGFTCDGAFTHEASIPYLEGHRYTVADA